MQLQSGQNCPLGSGTLNLQLRAEPSNSSLILDASAFLLTASGQVPGDEGFIFYGQPQHPSGGVRLDAQALRFAVDLDRLPATIERVILALSIDPQSPGKPSFRALEQVTLMVSGAGSELIFPLITSAMNETALIMGECYRRQGAWKFRALGQGFVGGLGPLAMHYGVEISDPQPAPAPQPAPPKAAPPPPPATPAPPPPAAPPAPPPSISLTKRQPISLDKPGSGFGKITVNLNWNRASTKRGFLGFGGDGIDLDLGCMLEMQDGFKTVVQALGNSFGDFKRVPYAHLLGDDRTGDSEEGEFLLINGEHWGKIKRVLIYAFIYEGAPDWATANAVVTISAPGISDLLVHLDEPGGDKGLCAIAMLDNDGGRLKVTKLIEYYTSQEPMDRAYGFGFRWRPGRK